MAGSVLDYWPVILFVHQYKRIKYQPALNLQLQRYLFVIKNNYYKKNIMNGKIQIRFLIYHFIIYGKHNGIVWQLYVISIIHNENIVIYCK